MSTSTVQTLATGFVTNLVDYFEIALPIIVPLVIGVTVLFGVIYWVRGLAHRR